jgi:spore germination cell wall hydrolase CwlJ-like protein
MIVAVLALTVIAPGYAKDESRAEQLSVTQHGNNNVSEKIQTLVSSLNKPLMKFDPKEFTCLAKNIFFESANEPEEGKVAVGLVTLNRVSSGKFKDTVCGVVDQKLSRDIPTIKIVEKKVGFFGQPLLIHTSSRRMAL